MAKQVNIGLIGTSWWAELVFLPVLQKYSRANLVAICGRNRERADDMAAQFDVPQVYTDYRQMIQQGDLEAIIVATPDDTHYEMVMAALDAGLHVLCEKPVALNADHALEMLDKAESVGVKHMVMYTHHWLPNLQQAKQLLEANYIGKVYHGYFNWLAGYARGRTYMWRYDANRANGVLGDLGSHMIHMAMWFLGDVMAVTGRLGYQVAREGTNGELSNPANDNVQFILEFASGAQVQFFVTAVAHVIDKFMNVSVALHGESGTIEARWIPGDPFEMSLHTQQSGQDERINETFAEDLTTFLEENPVGARLFVDSILDDKPIRPGLFAGYKVQQIIDAVMQSHETGCRVIIES